MPAQIDNGADPTLGAAAARAADRWNTDPDRGHPPRHRPERAQPEEAAAAFAAIGASDAHALDGPHALMHRTETVDYGIVLSGEVWLVVDDGETRLGPGDVVVQRGTNHAWSNRTEETARMAFVLVDGRFADELRPPTEE